jgi:hypothetical protein
LPTVSADPRKRFAPVEVVLSATPATSGIDAARTARTGRLAGEAEVTRRELAQAQHDVTMIT